MAHFFMRDRSYQYLQDADIAFCTEFSYANEASDVTFASFTYPETPCCLGSQHGELEKFGLKLLSALVR